MKTYQNKDPKLLEDLDVSENPLHTSIMHQARPHFKSDGQMLLLNFPVRGGGGGMHLI